MLSRAQYPSQMKLQNNLKNIFVIVIALVASVNFANAQSVRTNHKADSLVSTNYSKNAYMVVRHGNNSAKVEAAAVYDFMDKKAGAQAQLYWFHYGHKYGIEAGYMENRSSVNAFYGYRFTNPASKVYVEANVGAGLTQQWNISGNAGDIQGNVNGEYVMLLASSKMSFSCFGELKAGVKLGKRIELFAAARGLYLTTEGKYSDSANKLILESNGAPLKVVEKSAENKTELLVNNLKKFHVQASIGVSIWF